MCLKKEQARIQFIKNKKLFLKDEVTRKSLRMFQKFFIKNTQLSVKVRGDTISVHDIFQLMIGKLYTYYKLHRSLNFLRKLLYNRALMHKKQYYRDY